jgi:CMP-N,N'-diacetyllegionaminic acid synthase
MSKEKRLCTICARGGSQGVPNKNIRLLNGQPLINYTIETAKKSDLFDLIAVSSDSEDILNAAKEAGADILVKRPDQLATNKAAKIPAIIHAISEVEKITNKQYDILVDLDATSPLRLVDDLNLCVEQVEKRNVSNVITASPARRSPYFNLVELSADNKVNLSKPNINIIRRQDSPRCFDMNASIYVWKRDPFLDDPKIFYDDTALVVMPEKRSQDIDTELDFQIVEFIIKNQLNLGEKSYAI